MKKLIELLKQFDIKSGRQYPEYKIEKWIIYYVYHNPLEWDEYTDCTLNIISKKFWFIWWLVRENKIDLLKLTLMKLRYTDILVSHFSWEDRIIMILSVEDNPIEFLVSILK